MTVSTQQKLKLFSGRANRPLAERIARELSIVMKSEIPLGRLVVDDFPDGETNVRIDEDVRGRDVFIVQPTCEPVNQNLMELLVILDAFKRASPARITVVLPYYAYARQDRKDKGRVPITAKLVADVLTTAGANRVLCLDLHTAQIQGFFNIPVDHLYASREIIAYIRTLGIPPDEIVVLSSDEGAIKKALKYQKGLGSKQIAVVDKRRSNATTTEQAHIIGAPIDGKTVFVFDDMISTGGTIAGAARAARAAGAKRVFVASTHGVLCAGAVDKLRTAGIEKIITTDTIPIPEDKRKALPNLEVISVGKLLAEAIHRIHENYSLTVLFDD
ncbi:MAG: ribose-phosphate pyrophosphokinase [Planctomycetia bacterium]|nr:ribose-phosphate pyrophosphokinase [Planctomycetia bacterium]